MDEQTDLNQKKNPGEPKCSHCRDTGLYDACCRTHACPCEAGDKYRPQPGHGGNYGDYGPGRYR